MKTRLIKGPSLVATQEETNCVTRMVEKVFERLFVP